MTTIWDVARNEEPGIFPPKILISLGWRHYNLWYWTTNPWKIPPEMVKIVQETTQRATRGWSTPDSYSLDSYLLKWLPDAIDALADRKLSYPLVEGAQTWGEWEPILRRISAGLRAGREIQEGFPDSARTEEILAEFNEAWELLGKWFFHMWD